ncbi:hypothetical protein LshimejAT787_1005570 [Lyophyllum shimeji]|uniref:Uncharacterized protein n=1 Tax=Lyophyllum shimeji TaxID=47721 RepID=A0A9P3PVC3_LYOSH|nr:hypothetical protein LshimejAT787_1005570 [Lyophyllum shimeji]
MFTSTLLHAHILISTTSTDNPGVGDHLPVAVVACTLLIPTLLDLATRIYVFWIAGRVRTGPAGCSPGPVWCSPASIRRVRNWGYIWTHKRCSPGVF